MYVGVIAALVVFGGTAAGVLGKAECSAAKLVAGSRVEGVVGASAIPGQIVPAVKPSFSAVSESAGWTSVSACDGAVGLSLACLGRCCSAFSLKRLGSAAKVSVTTGKPARAVLVAKAVASACACASLASSSAS